MQMLHLRVVLSLLASLMFGPVLAPSGARAAGPMMQVAETTFIGSTVLVIDQAAHQLTVRTAEGNVFTLPVVNPQLLTGLTKGDRVSFEIDIKERIVTLVKITGGQSTAAERGG